MSEPLLTIGMAHYADYDGVYFTIQALRLNNSHLMDRVEFVVIDNSPTLPEASAIQDLFKNIRDATGQYIPMSGPVGTSPSRNAIFAHARGKYVLAMDCHVLLWPGALEALLLYYQQNPECSDILSGPMFYDSLNTFTTHFNNVWRSEMLGVWATAWECPCKEFLFTMRDGRDGAEPVTLDMNHLMIHECPKCHKDIPRLGWGGHERQYEALGFTRPGPGDGGKPFEIPGMGLGLFSCRREAWLGFHQAARGFGGEELYIHEKYRQAGHKSICLPALKWLHRFGRPAGVKYPLTRWFKIRNYVLEFKELGLDLQPIYDHFVPTGLMGNDAWQKLIADPVGMEQEPQNSGCSSCGGGAPVLPEFSSVEDIYQDVKRRPRDLDQHMPTLRHYAGHWDRVTEFTARRESTIAFLASEPTTLTSYSTEVDGHVLKGVALLADKMNYERKPFIMGQIFPDIAETDTLFVDTKHSYAHLKAELMAYGRHVQHYIILHDTVVYGEKGDDGGPGLMLALYEFIQANPMWEVIFQSNEQYGLTVLAWQETDKPQGPGRELKKLLSSIGIDPAPSCECNARATQMNEWGVDGCRQHRDEIIAWMKDGQVKWGWREKFIAATKVAASVLKSDGIVWKLDLLDPMPGLVDEAINRAEKRLLELEATRQKELDAVRLELQEMTEPGAVNLDGTKPEKKKKGGAK